MVAAPLLAATAQPGLVDALLVLAMAIVVHAVLTARSAAAGNRQAGTARQAPVTTSRHSIIFAVDVAGFTDRSRDDQVQLAVRRVLYELLATAFEASGVGWGDCCHEDRGDGVVVVIPARMPTVTVIDPLVTHLRAGLRCHNRLAVRAAQIRLRVAVHVGEVHRDEHGLAGTAVNYLFRLLDAGALRAALVSSDGELAVIVSDYLYESVVRHAGGLIDRSAFRQVTVHVKELRAPAWIYVPGAQPAALAAYHPAAGHPASPERPAPPGAN